MIKQITSPTTEPVTLDELKLAPRIDNTDLDAKLYAALSVTSS